MQPEAWGGMKRILAVRLDNVGDVVMLGPALRAIAASCPDADITLLASPAGGRAAALLPHVADVLVWRAPWHDLSPSRPLDPAREAEMIATLGDGHFDAAFIFTGFSQAPWAPAFACYLAGIPVRIGQARDFGGSLLTHVVRPLPDCAHQVDRNLHLLESVGIPRRGSDLQVCLTPATIASGDALLASVGLAPSEPFVVVAPGASRAARRYPAQRFGEVLSLLARRTGLPIVLVGHPREAETIAAIKSAARSRQVLVPGGDTSLEQLTALIARARLLLANNAGPMHLADAVRCPMVVLFSGSDLEEQWRPRQALAALLRRPTPCDPCYRFECPFQMECLDIPAREVVQACEDVLARTAHRAPSHVAVLRRAGRHAARTAPRASTSRSLSLGSEGAEP